MKRSLTITCALVGAMTLAAPLAATAASKHAAKAKPEAALPDLSQEQLDNAGRVLVGKIECEFNQSIDISESTAKKGYFVAAFKGKKYTLTPEATTTGAVRLEDKKAGVVWLQIGNKSMLMNAKAGQRMVDNCVHPSQKS
jgi:hypothetical protein